MKSHILVCFIFLMGAGCASPKDSQVKAHNPAETAEKSAGPETQASAEPQSDLPPEPAQGGAAVKQPEEAPKGLTQDEINSRIADILNLNNGVWGKCIRIEPVADHSAGISSYRAVACFENGTKLTLWVKVPGDNVSFTIGEEHGRKYTSQEVLERCAELSRDTQSFLNTHQGKDGLRGMSIFEVKQLYDDWYILQLRWLQATGEVPLTATGAQAYRDEWPLGDDGFAGIIPAYVAARMGKVRFLSRETLYSVFGKPDRIQFGQGRTFAQYWLWYECKDSTIRIRATCIQNKYDGEEYPMMLLDYLGSF